MVGVLFLLYNTNMSEILLRPVTTEDADIILKWRNDAATRENSFSKDVISHEDHMKWFDKKMADENCFMYMLTDDGVPVGHIRIDKEKNIGEISYMTAPDKRGKGYGKLIICECEKVLPDSIRVLVGIIIKENTPSGKCFIANGYTEISGGTENSYIKVL